MATTVRSRTFDGRVVHEAELKLELAEFLRDNSSFDFFHDNGMLFKNGEPVAARGYLDACSSPPCEWCLLEFEVVKSPQ